MIKVLLCNGEIETLLTDLSDQQLPAFEADELYFKRWGIETAYDNLKSKFQLENFSAKTEIGVRQDFYATAYLMGFAEICAADATRSIENADQGKDLKYHRKANMNRTIEKLRTDFWAILLEEDPVIRNILLDHLCRNIASRPEPVRPAVLLRAISPETSVFPSLKKPFCLKLMAMICADENTLETNCVKGYTGFQCRKKQFLVGLWI